MPAAQVVPAVVPGLAAGPREAQAVQQGVAKREPLEALPEAFEHESQQPQPADARIGFLRVKPHPDTAAPEGAVDSMGVPGLFCLWILNCLRCVGNVFSFRFLHLHYRDNTLTGAAANTAKHSLSAKVTQNTSMSVAKFPGPANRWEPGISWLGGFGEFARLWRNLVELYSVTKSGSGQFYPSANNRISARSWRIFKFRAEHVTDTRDVAENDSGGRQQRSENNAGVPPERPTAPSGSSLGGRNSSSF